MAIALGRRGGGSKHTGFSEANSSQRPPQHLQLSEATTTSSAKTIVRSSSSGSGNRSRGLLNKCRTFTRKWEALKLYVLCALCFVAVNRPTRYLWMHSSCHRDSTNATLVKLVVWPQKQRKTLDLGVACTCSKTIISIYIAHRQGNVPFKGW